MKNFEWKPEFQISNTIFGPDALRLTALDNGGFVAVFVDEGRPSVVNNDIRAVILDAEGNVAVPAFITHNASRIDNEIEPAVAALPGGFVVVYRDLNNNTPGRDILRYDRYQNDGALIRSGTIPIDNRPDFDDGGDLFLGDASVTGLADGGFVVTYGRQIREGGFRTNDFDDIVGYAATAEGAVGPQQEIRRDPDDDSNAPGETSRPQSATLANGDIATVYREQRSGDPNDQDLAVTVSRVSGTSLSEVGFTRFGTGTFDGKPSIAALTGGGFVVAWVSGTTNGSNNTVHYGLFDDDGDRIGAIATAFTGAVDVGGGGRSSGAAVAALPDGGFVLAVDENNKITLRTHDANGDLNALPGAPDGVIVAFPNGPFEFDFAAGLGVDVTTDGRIVLGYRDNDTYQTSIWDTRDSTVTGSGGPDVLTAPQDGDPAAPGDQPTIVAAFAGDDTVIGGRADDLLDGGAGNDLIRGQNGDDMLRAGDGDGSGNANTLIGGAGEDTLVGDDGDDVLYGDLPSLDGFDWVLNPDNGHYYAFVTGSTTWTGAQAAADALGEGVHLATITSEAEADFIGSVAPATGLFLGGVQERTGLAFRWTSGEDFGYVNWLSGNPDNPDRGGREAIVLQTATDSEGRVWDDVSSTSARAGGFVLELDSANDMLLGGAGDDTLFGGLGNDTVDGGPGFDVTNGGPGHDILIADRSFDIMNGGPDADIFSVAAASPQFIEDFQQGVDVIDLTGAGVRVFNELSFDDSFDARDIRFNGGRLILENQAGLVLRPGDFDFLPGLSTVSVTTLADEDDGETAPGDISLREALDLVAPGGTITFAPSVIEPPSIFNPVPGLMELERPLNSLRVAVPNVTIDGDVDGDGVADIKIDGGQQTTVFVVEDQADGTQIRNLSLLQNRDFSDPAAFREARGLDIRGDTTLSNVDILGARVSTQ